MKTIWKYEIILGGRVKIDMPKDATMLHFEVQREIPRLWALVDSDNKTEPREFVIVGTGHSIDKGLNLKYIGTTLMMEDRLVWHLFEVI